VKGSEIVSISWIVIFALFAIAVFVFADKNRNKQWIENVGAFIFSALIIATFAAAMAPHFFSYVLDVWWWDGSNINTTAWILCILICWAVLTRGWELFIALASLSLVFGAISWVVTRFIL